MIPDVLARPSLARLGEDEGVREIGFEPMTA